MSLGNSPALAMRAHRAMDGLGIQPWVRGHPGAESLSPIAVAPS